MVSSVNNDKILQKQSFISSKTIPINFRAQDAATSILEKTPSKDVVEISATKEDKQGLSKGAKWGIGIASALGTLITAGILIQKHEFKRLTKLFDKRLTISNLPENIQFKEAKTLEEAIKFAKETLGIGYIDKKFNLEMLNYANKGIVDVSNANKGRIFVPKKLLVCKDEGAIAFTVQDIESKMFGTLAINPEFFTHESLNKKLTELFVNPKTTIVDSAKKKAKEEFQVRMLTGLSKDTWKLLDKFKQNPNNLSLVEKIQIYANLKSGSRQAGANIELKEKFPLEWLRNNQSLFKESNIEVDFSKLKALSKEAQAEEVNKLLKTWAEKTNINEIVYHGPDNPYHTLYHEMGHLQDYATNLEKLQKEELARFNFFTVMKNAFKNKNGKINSIADHWGGTTYKTEQELMEKSPEMFKEMYPNLYKHINDAETQRIASYVGDYATTGIGEFIAETYAHILTGRKLPKEVIDLYKKYNGPLIPRI